MGLQLLVGLFDVEEEGVKFGEQGGVRQLQSPHPLRHLRPLEPVGPVGPRPEIDPAVIPLPGIRRPAVIVHGRGREQQQVAGLHGEGMIPLKDLPLAPDGQVDDETFHTLGPVDDEVEGAPLLYGGHARDQEDVEGVTRQQGIELFRLLFLHRRHGGKQRLGKKIGLGHCRDSRRWNNAIFARRPDVNLLNWLTAGCVVSHGVTRLSKARSTRCLHRLRQPLRCAPCGPVCSGRTARRRAG